MDYEVAALTKVLRVPVSVDLRGANEPKDDPV
jgi:hypothetical protein